MLAEITEKSERTNQNCVTHEHCDKKYQFVHARRNFAKIGNVHLKPIGRRFINKKKHATRQKHKAPKDYVLQLGVSKRILILARHLFWRRIPQKVRGVKVFSRNLQKNLSVFDFKRYKRFVKFKVFAITLTF